MNRRGFFQKVAQVALGMVTVSLWPKGSHPLARPLGAKSHAPALNIRSQQTAEDLVAEYRAWVAGDLDDHDIAVLARKAHFSEGHDAERVPQYHHLGRRHLVPLRGELRHCEKCTTDSQYGGL